ncbi:MAG: hypothetical protein IKP88_06860 [Lachnospiraceae bacterium]|nr:hypothetical protein [Erysipelotrichaceae bacterium]MBR4342408.1 hypothetical protein [Lachnospiraceae bacterium]
MVSLKGICLLVLRKIAEHSKENAVFRRMYNGERLKHYRDYLMSAEDIKQALLMSINKRESVINKYNRQYMNIMEQAKQQTNSILPHISYLKDVNTNDILNDVCFCKLAYGIEPEEYFSYHLFYKNNKEREQYISDRELMFMVYQMNDRVDIKLFNDKAETYHFFKKYYKRDCIVIKDNSDYQSFCNYVKKHPTFVKKKVNEAMGRSVELISIGQEEDIKKVFFKIIQDGKHLLEERILQDNELSSYNISSVNTLRLITFYTNNGVIVPFGFMKFGRKGSFVDNGGAGGLLVGIDINTGKLITNGFDEFGNIFEKHPDSKKEFIGYQLPEYQSAVDLAIELSHKVPSVKYIGWDFAYSDRGWVIVEGNGMSQIIGPQTVFEHGLKNNINEIKKEMTLFNI